MERGCSPHLVSIGFEALDRQRLYIHEVQTRCGMGLRTDWTGTGLREDAAYALLSQAVPTFESRRAGDFFSFDSTTPTSLTYTIQYARHGWIDWVSHCRDTHKTTTGLRNLDIISNTQLDVPKASSSTP